MSGSRSIEWFSICFSVVRCMDYEDGRDKLHEAEQLVDDSRLEELFGSAASLVYKSRREMKSEDFE